MVRLRNCLNLSSGGSSVVLVDFRFDVTDQGDQVGDDLSLVACHGPVHGLYLDLGVSLDLDGDVLLGANILGLIFLECSLPLRLVLLNLDLSLLFGLLEPPVLPLPRLSHLLSSSLFSCKKLLDSLSLASHLFFILNSLVEVNQAIL